MTVKKRKDTKTNRKFVHRVADIPGGVSVYFADNEKREVREGDLLAVIGTGNYAAIRVFEVAGSNNDKTLVIDGKHIDDPQSLVGMHFNFEGPFDDSTEGYDKDGYGSFQVVAAEKGTTHTNVSLTLDKAHPATNSWAQTLIWGTHAIEFNHGVYRNCAIAGTSKSAEAGDNVDVDAWVIGVTRGVRIPEPLKKLFTGIVNIDTL